MGEYQSFDVVLMCGTVCLMVAAGRVHGSGDRSL